ncbi:PAS domain-containing sensor histidine kinase [Brevibacillus daliensis]|uniref:PAS domain-containing sensor histidine kinase n=1 Tax=Brevibacillus daliensis TaxID=2892995 RepID=UPI001E2E1A07|nr:PAS domain-containing sensor histidine kinase [Brevibacillus daliensis]
MKKIKSLSVFRSVSDHEILNHLPTEIIQIDENGTIGYVNSSCENLLSMSAEDLLGKPLYRLFPSFSLQECLDSHSLMKEKSRGEQYLYTWTKDHHYLYVKAVITPYTRKEKTYFLLTLSPTGKKKRWRRVFEQFRREHAPLLANTPDAFFCLDLNGYFRTTNHVCTTLLGYTKVELLQKNIFDLIGSDQRCDVALFYEQIKKKEPCSASLTVFHQDGTPLLLHIMLCPLLSHNKVIGLYGIAREQITEQQLEDELWEAQVKYDILAKHSSDLIVFLDARGKIVFVSPSHEDALGYPVDTFYKKNILGFIHPEDIPRMEKWFFSAYGEVTASEAVEFRALHADGRYLYIRLTCVPMHGKDGVLLGYIVIGQNINDQRLAEELLRRSETLSVLGELAAGIAHEIRNPLTALRGFTQLLQSQSDVSQKYASIMLNELDRIHFIVNELLMLAKPQSYQLNRRDIVSLLQDVITLLESQALLANVSISSNWDQHMFPILCEERQLKQVFINIMKNSVEAMPNGGTIYIEGKQLENNTILLRFTDEGNGMDAKLLEQVGKPFYTTKETGTGLGLMISTKIIREHSGSLTLSSAPGKGTIVEIILPASVV